MTLSDNTVHYDMNSLATGAFKIRLLSHEPGFSRSDLIIHPFGRVR
jgi:hypothetical protein